MVAHWKEERKVVEVVYVMQRLVLRKDKSCDDGVGSVARWEDEKAMVYVMETRPLWEGRHVLWKGMLVWHSSGWAEIR